MVRPMRSASWWSRAARRWTTADEVASRPSPDSPGPPSAVSATRVSASRPNAPTGVLSSWLMFETKSRRRLSTRLRSEMSSITMATPSTVDAVPFAEARFERSGRAVSR